MEVLDETRRWTRVAGYAGRELTGTHVGDILDRQILGGLDSNERGNRSDTIPVRKAERGNRTEWADYQPQMARG